MVFQSRYFTFIALALSIVSYQNCGKSFQVLKLTDKSVLQELSSQSPTKRQVDLIWNRTLFNNDESPASIRGYKIYIGTSSEDYKRIISEDEVGDSTEYRVSDLESGTTYYLSISAIANDGTESEHSAEISYTAP